MTDGFGNRPKILRGALVEFGLSLPPLFVVFQFNPLQLTRNRTLSYAPGAGGGTSLRDFHKRYDSLTDLRDAQQVTVSEEVIGLEIRLDASDGLEQGDAITGQFGISPQLSTLELMVHPKDESLIGQVVGDLLGAPDGFSFTKRPRPPLTLFVFGRKRVLPVNITSLNITELLHSPDLNPVRATATLGMTVIEGKSMPYLYSKAMKEAMSVLNLANVADVANVMIPG
ncbi:hypothetical protein JOF56_006925 [Kibdelosporangium banguiense]|uniref:DUF5753 domain-containing protein n=1 Tax=Kibdelosporangium banguiense TaxID=1365924 RepID=A0ABS4TRG7_9PSEU|nr:hypothetical protein [Kibdelosporangium banguiense]MBP2326540.1 hypothetical protein [Kibdelosporangium banguiense]